MVGNPFDLAILVICNICDLKGMWYVILVVCNICDLANCGICNTHDGCSKDTPTGDEIKPHFRRVAFDFVFV